MFENIEIEIGNEKIKIFERFPELKPYVYNYWTNNTHRQLLLIGESNFFRKSDSNHFQNTNDWYKNAPKEELIPDKELKVSVANGSKIEASQLKGLNQSIKKMNLDSTDVAFYNYFLRPALNEGKENGFGRKGYYQDIDGEVAFAAFCGILKELKPNLVIFATRVGFERMEEFRNKTRTDFAQIVDGVVIERVSHPSCSWWNYNDGIYGHQKFERLLCEHWLKEKPAYYLNFEKLQDVHAILKQKFNVEKEPKCFSWKGKYLSILYFQIKNYSFCCEINIEINGVNYWSGFYRHGSQIPQEVFENTSYEFRPTDNNDTIAKNIEDKINLVINRLNQI
jgi:hypothetical protein